MDNPITAVNTFLEQANLNNLKIVLAYSAGVDSTALLDVLIKIRNPKSLNIVLAYFDHGVRRNTIKDKKLIEHYANKFKLEYYIGENPIKGYQSENTLRVRRYKFLNQVAKISQAKYIVLAHHLDDNLETIIQRIIRGTSVWGLKGIAPIRDNYLRPLLMVSKNDILQYAAKNKLIWQEDISNLDININRNLLRKILSPENKFQLLDILKNLPDLNELEQKINLFLAPYLTKPVLSLGTEFMSLDNEIKLELIYRFIRKKGYQKQIPLRILLLIQSMLKPINKQNNSNQHFNKNFPLKSVELDINHSLKLKSIDSQLYLKFERK